MENQNLMPFTGKSIRTIEHKGAMWFSIVDIIEVLTDSSKPNRYWADIKKRSIKESNQPFAFCEQLKLTASDGRKRLTDCANTEGVLRIIMSVPSPKVEPLKLWLAEQGKQAMDEAADPELGFDRLTETYKAKGRTDEWIKERFQSIETRKRLTDEWKNRGVKAGQEYSVLTATIAKGTFGLTPSEHSKIKGLDNQNLRDHMTPLELILTSLSEEVTRTIAIDHNAQGFHENHDAAVRGGQIGRKALLNVEEGTGKKVVSTANYVNLPTEKSEELPLNTAKPTELKGRKLKILP